jgi:hypothetical protein
MHKLYTTNIRHSQQKAHHTLPNIMNQCNELLARDKDEIHVIVKHMLGLRVHQKPTKSFRRIIRLGIIYCTFSILDFT